MSGVQEQKNKAVNMEDNIGLSQHLEIIADKLLIVREKEKDRERKEEIYRRVFELLEGDALEIQEMVATLNLEAPEAVMEICKGVDETFARAANYFLTSIDLLIEFLNTEDVNLVEEAKNAVKEGANLLEEAERQTEELKNIPMIDEDQS